jgi:tRNA-dihydrouridine synthase A
MTKNAMLYTEMVTAGAVLHGPRAQLLDFSECEHPVALQLGGSVPAELARAVSVASDWGYDEINLNVGCPSDRVQSGCFGAVLMEQPNLVAECVAAMGAQTGVPITVKCRIGVDDQIPQDVLPRFIETVSAAGVSHFIIHARMAWLKGLSPKENREVPPLDYPLVRQIKQDFPSLTICINGGIATLAQARAMLDSGLDGVMLGRAAYHNPGEVLLQADTLWGDSVTQTEVQIVHQMRPYIEAHIAGGGRLHQMTRHMLGLFSGQPGARRWRRLLSEQANQTNAGFEVVLDALDQIVQPQDTEAQAHG